MMPFGVYFLPFNISGLRYKCSDADDDCVRQIQSSISIITFGRLRSRPASAISRRYYGFSRRSFIGQIDYCIIDRPDLR